MRQWIAISVLAAVAVGCSPTQKETIGKAQVGTINEQGFAREWYTIAMNGLDAKRSRMIDASYTTLEMAMAGQLKDEKGAVVAPDRAWLDGHKKNLLVGPAAIEEEKGKYDRLLEQQLGNLSTQQKYLDMTANLNTAYAGNADEIASRLVKIEAMIQKMQAK